MPTVDSTRGVVCTPAAVRPLAAADAGFLAVLLPPVTGVLRSTITTRGVREAERGAEAGAAWSWPPAAGVRRAVAGVLRATEAEPSTGVPSAWEQGEQGMGVRQEATTERGHAQSQPTLPKTECATPRSTPPFSTPASTAWVLKEISWVQSCAAVAASSMAPICGSVVEQRSAHWVQQAR